MEAFDLLLNLPLDLSRDSPLVLPKFACKYVSKMFFELVKLGICAWSVTSEFFPMFGHGHTMKMVRHANHPESWAYEIGLVCNSTLLFDLPRLRHDCSRFILTYDSKDHIVKTTIIFDDVYSDAEICIFLDKFINILFRNKFKIIANIDVSLTNTPPLRPITNALEFLKGATARELSFTGVMNFLRRVPALERVCMSSANLDARTSGDAFAVTSRTNLSTAQKRNLYNVYKSHTEFIEQLTVENKQVSFVLSRNYIFMQGFHTFAADVVECINLDGGDHFNRFKCTFTVYFGGLEKPDILDMPQLETSPIFAHVAHGLGFASPEAFVEGIQRLKPPEPGPLPFFA